MLPARPSRSAAVPGFIADALVIAVTLAAALAFVLVFIAT